MKNEVHNLLASYYACLNGNIPGFEVFQLTADDDYKGDYVLLRAESEADTSNRERFVTQPVVIVDIVTHHDQQIDASRVEVADNVIRGMIFPTRRTTGLSLSGSQLLNVRMSDAFYQDEFDGSRYIHRKISRYINRINQT